ncbi:MAG: hypothetical protein KC516_01070 [Nanoarchaeota archaeon]|nr:hypothetical protein [Nanoarchaeota archaeon]
MEEKKYTQKELDQGKIDAIKAYISWESAKMSYETQDKLGIFAIKKSKSSEEYKIEFNLAVDKCNKILPKSLIDKLEIKKID